MFCRMPGETRGTIIDVAQRVIPYVEGDGQHTVAELIEQRSEWRPVQTRLKARCAPELLTCVPSAGELVALVVAATSSTGALFIDSRQLATPALAERLSEVAAPVPGFHLGKFDIKVATIENLQQGRGLKIIEVNGSTSELTYIFDRRIGYVHALFAIAKHLDLMFSIARQNRTAPCPSITSVVRAYFAFADKLRRTDA